MIRHGLLFLTLLIAVVAAPSGPQADESPALRSAQRVLIIIPGEGPFDRFTRLLDAIFHDTPQIALTYSYVPEAEALERLRSGQADMVVPYPAMPLSGKDFMLSQAPVTKAFYVLYTNTAKPLDPARLTQHVIEGDARNSAILGLPLQPSSGPAASLSKLHQGSIDGYINAEGATDPVLRQLQFRNIRRDLYKQTVNYVLLPGTEAGRQTDKLLSEAVSKATGRPGYDVMQERPYGDWQP